MVGGARTGKALAVINPAEPPLIMRDTVHCLTETGDTDNLERLSVQARKREAEVALTRKEYAVLAQLARHPGRVITQQQLLKDIWGPTHVEDSHYLRVVVGHLRQKLGDDPAAPRFIVTEAGVGYRLREL